MLSIGKLSAGQGGYYLAEIAHGAEDYYTERGEVPGRWIGRGAEMLDLVGEVADEDFVSILAGVTPGTGERLGRPNRRRPGFDLTLSAPKSVSLAWALGDPDTTAAIVQAHEAAVDAVIGYLEAEVITARKGHNGVEQIAGGGLVAAAFRHRASRAGDPQLHTHVVAANATRCQDGNWRALDARWLFAHARTAGHLYQAELRWQLGRRFAIEWTEPHKGMADVAGIPTAALKEFSTRRAQITKATRGDSAGAARAAALATRTKKRLVDISELRVDWLHRAALHHLDNTLVQTTFRPRHQELAADVQVSVLDAAAVGDMVTEHQAIFDRRHIIQALAGSTRQGAPVTAILSAADNFVTDPTVVLLAPDRYGCRYTTTGQLALEEQLLTGARRRSWEHTGVCADLEKTWAEFPTLTVEQRAMVQAVTTDGAGVSVVVGGAGAGKTFALKAAHHAWARHSFDTIGCALAARAAKGLETETGIASQTIARLLTELDDGQRSLTTSTVLVVDEAAMVGTRTLARLLDHADTAAAKVVLVGDHRQLPEIDAGGAFAALAHGLPTAILTENRRQGNRAEREALTDIRDGDVAIGVAALSQLGRVRSFADSAEARDQLVSDWLAVRDQGHNATMLALHRADVDDLNQRARARLQQRGDLETPAGDGGQVRFCIGERVVALRNRYDLGLLNGQTGTIERADDTGPQVLVRLDDGSPRLIPASYVEEGWLTWAYATTIHKAQGQTSDHAFLLADDTLYREAGYTGLSRARHGTTIYWIDGDDEPSDIGQALARSHRQELALTASPTWHQTRNAEPEITLDSGIDIGP